ncbi:MAG: hypothetical protein K1X36_00900 [Pyrinomonadaceae bacterium]|nr:hypothetical protein [Pyrinomonadaceae bacterium]
MKYGSLVAVFGILLAISVFPPAASSQAVNFTVASAPWNGDMFGNIRAVVMVENAEKTAYARIEWRRRDLNPAEKSIIVTTAGGRRVTTTSFGAINREFGEVYFEPMAGPGVYYVYYLPYVKSGSANYPKDYYPKPADGSGEHSVLVGTEVAFAKVVAIESIDAFNSFYPMEVIATAGETDALVKANGARDFLVFPEDRMFPIRMTNDLPQRWIESGPRTSFSGEARRGEFYAFQFGIYAVKAVENVRVSFTDLKAANGAVIPAAAATCINTSGIGYDAKPFTKAVSVPQGKVQAMWCGIDVPVGARSGIYKGTAKIIADDAAAQTVVLVFSVSNEIAVAGGANEPEKMTRLKWLNSTLAQENTVIPPYTPIVVKGNEISILGRSLVLSNDGLPGSIATRFSPEMTSMSGYNQVLERPMSMSITDVRGSAIAPMPKGVVFTEKTPGTVSWRAPTKYSTVMMDTEGSMEFDGFIAYTVKITALEDVRLDDINLSIPYSKNAAKYMMGLGEKGRATPSFLKWKWDVATRNQDGAWLGGVNAGMQFSLRDEKYVRPLNTNFYLQKPLLLPSSWGNGGKGGIDIDGSSETGTVVKNYSGPRTMKKGDVLYYNFNLLITPFHTIDTDWQWANRFYHKYTPVDDIKKTGSTVVNIHHANAINPYINYPFIAHKEMKAYIDEAHTKGLKVKIYNTVRELSNRAYELPALRSLGHEIFSAGKGGGFSWLQEHVGDDYIAAWFVPELKDAAIVNSGVSRWHNYYVEGMNWLTQNVGIDGIYLDDVAFDRVTMKRVKRVLTAGGHPGIVDLHSANQFNKNDGFNNSAMLYLEHFPYLNRLWFGEYFDYENNSPDFFLTEVSGIPFGLMGEMLEKGGNPWRGMIYGMTNRMPWSDNADPRPLWKAWDDFGMKGTQMYGYWSPNCMVRTNDPKVLSTVYWKKGSALVSIASWAESDTDVQLEIDWRGLGIDASRATITAPEIAGFQSAASFKPDDKIRVVRNKGLLLVIKQAGK